MSTTNRSGFSLVEVAVALGLATLLLLGVFSTLSMGTRLASAGREREIAREAARARLEALQTLCDQDPGLVSALTGTDFAVPNPDDSVDLDGNGSRDVIPHNRLVSAVAGRRPGLITVNPIAPRLLRATVRIDWRASDGSTSRYQLTAILSQRT